MKIKRVLLCIMDGVGLYKDYKGNAFINAKTPTLDRLWAENPHSHVDASGEFVGLPDGQMGNSEVGHMNIGAGRVVKQLLPRINEAVEKNTIKDQKEYKKFKENTKSYSNTVNVIGLLSNGGIHSHISHIIGLCKTLANDGFQVNFHAITDGRDTPQESALLFIKEFKIATNSLKNINISTICGRFYAMDRNNNDDRTKEYFTLLNNSNKEAKTFKTPEEAILESYKLGVQDEFIKPLKIEGFNGIKDGESFVFANFRSDRARQICNKLSDGTIKFSAMAGIADYSADLSKKLITFFPDLEINETIGQIISEHGLKQLRIAETEKYAHVTFFLNGGKETLFQGEDRILIPSPNVKTYDETPKMSAEGITTALLSDLDQQKHDLIILNYANGDMVGHTGDLLAAEKAMECVDKQIAQLEAKCLEKGYYLLITADHGNCEIMIDEISGKPMTAHTTNQVPFIVIEPKIGNDERKIATAHNGALCDISPTILKIMEIKQPAEMTGKSLIEFK